MTGYHPRRQHRRYLRATRRAFATVTFYREQITEFNTPLPEPRPTPAAALPDPPHTLVPFARPWSAQHEPSLWTPRPQPLAAVLRLAGCRDQLPVLEVRQALWDRTRIGNGWRRRRYAVLLSPTARVASPQRREELNQDALAVVGNGPGWLVGTAEELAALPKQPQLRPVLRLPIQAVVDRPDDLNAASPPPAVLHEPRLGYVGARKPECGQWHLDWRRVYARERDGQLTLSRLDQRRPTLLGLLVPGADHVRVDHCPRHRTPVLVGR